MSALERLSEDLDKQIGCDCGSCLANQVVVGASDLRELITAAESREAALHAETERGNALAVRVVELEADAQRAVAFLDQRNARLLDERDGLQGAVATLRAELAGAQSQAAAAKREADVQNRACAEEMHKREYMQRNWDQMIASVKHHYEAQMRAEDTLRARDAEVPGLSTTPYYTMDDVDRIESVRGKPYAKLRETVELIGVVRDLFGRVTNELEAHIGGPQDQNEEEAALLHDARMVLIKSFDASRDDAATSNETKEVES